MKPIFITLTIAIVLASCQQENTDSNMAIKYPETRKDTTVKNKYFGTVIKDPYRWLEDDLSQETAEWVEQENEVTEKYLSQIPYREAIKKHLTELLDYEKYSAPFNRGDYTYYYKNDGLQNQYVLWRQKGDNDPEVFLDPNTFSEDGTISLSGIHFTKDGSLAAYQISEGGSDWRKVIVINTETKEIVEDTLRNVKFSNISWKENDGFYYSSYDKPEEGSALSGMTDMHKLYYHKLATNQKDDELIYGGNEKPRRYIQGSVTEDGKYLEVMGGNSTTGFELLIQDLTKPGSKLEYILANFDTESDVITTDGDNLIIMTNLNAPNNRVVKVKASNPGPENWEDLIPETDNVLKAGAAGKYIFAKYIKDAVSVIKQFDMNGKFIREIQLPGPGTADGFNGRKEDKEVYYYFANYIHPSTLFKLNLKTGNSEVYKESGVKFNPDEYESKQVFYKSKDDTQIPMIITYKKGIDLNGKNPTMLYGYGGFNISLTPWFSTSLIIWLENGGVYAVANLRGGGEYGEKWHLAGVKMKKQNVFDDFIAATQYLMDKQYTNPEYLAIHGGSNGGLLVGAVITQHPEMFKVAIPAVGVLDMLRYHKFTAGAGWAYDYGTSEDSKEMFEYLVAYSPYHNLKKGVKYPATLILTADHDDRVVPAHSFKFAARLQECQAGNNPVLIRIETKAGHGAGKPTSKIIDEQADKWAFSFYNMGIEKLIYP
jgi:prolyl oligopeptidase